MLSLPKEVRVEVKVLKVNGIQNEISAAISQICSSFSLNLVILSPPVEKIRLIHGSNLIVLHKYMSQRSSREERIKSGAGHT